MIELQLVKKELRRLTGLSFPPTEPEGWTELAKVLQRRCLTMDHVERVLSRWLETEENVPKPSQLASMCSEVPADPAGDQPILPSPCEKCAPEGLWRYVERLARDGSIVECAARCTCARGCQLAALDSKRAMEEASKNRKQPAMVRLVDPPEAIGQ
jgi:hypothetical protein